MSATSQTSTATADGLDARLALWCLTRVARHYRLDVDERQIAHEQALTTARMTPRKLIEAATSIGLAARAKTLVWTDLGAMGEALPALLLLKNGRTAILSGTRTDRGREEVVVLDPSREPVEFAFLGREELEAIWDGDVVLVSRRYKLSDPEQPFSLQWFVPQILKERQAVIDVSLAVLFLHALALAVPLFFQIVIDKVVVHQGISTLTVLTIGIVIALIFDAALSYLRSYILLHASAKIDIRVTTRIFEHLLALPISFFEPRPAGVLLKHVQQNKTIREFLTGRLLQTLLDATGLIVFIPILFLYSGWLTLVVFAYTSIIALIILLISGPFRSRLTILYRAEAERQALLAEAIHGIATVKSLGMEPMQRRSWNDRSAFAIERYLDVGKISTLARVLSGLLEKLMSVTVIATGVWLVFGDALTIGALVAFQMLAGRVTGPLVQLVGLVHDYQDAALSVRMLGEVMNAPAEPRINRGLRSRINGAISFEDVTFTYPGGSVPALDHVTFEVQPGTTLGVVGRSGSGKSTLVKMMQGLIPAQRGLIRVDGTDINEFDKTHLRMAIGVVSQETFLFRGTVRDNIASGRPTASIEEVVQAARIAGAEEFIQRLPRGYETDLEEGAVNLSGGQRQRLAIARALLRNPRILIFDEATSALDPESEAIVQQQLAAIARTRTTIVVSHRLAYVRPAHRILVLEQGRVAGFEAHDPLLQSCLPYRALWLRQAQAFQGSL